MADYLRIEPAGIVDIMPLCDLIELAFKTRNGDLDSFTFDRNTVKAKLVHYIKDPSFDVLVTKNGTHTPIGVAVVQSAGSLLDQKNKQHVVLAVEPDHRLSVYKKAKVYRKLVMALLDKYEAGDGNSVVMMEHRSFNNAKFLSKLGFRPVETVFLKKLDKGGE